LGDSARVHAQPGRGNRPAGVACPAFSADPFLVDSARARRDAQRGCDELHDRLAAAQRELSDAEAAVKFAERRFDVADEQIAEAERALEVARAQREGARRQRYAARRARDRTRVVVDRLKRRLVSLSSWLARISLVCGALMEAANGHRYRLPGPGHEPGPGGWPRVRRRW
jgi:hypothetical protein